MIKLFSSKYRSWAVGAGFAVLLVAIFALVSPIMAQGSDTVEGSLGVTGGSLTMTASDNPVFTSVTLNGTNQTTTDTIDVGVTDLTGTGAGWNLQITSTQFTNGSQTLDTDTTTITGVTTSCDQTTCTDPTNSTVTYSVTVPAGVAEPAVKFFSADANTGMGDFTVTPTFSMAVPATTYAGTYTSTMTISLVSAP